MESVLAILGCIVGLFVICLAFPGRTRHFNVECLPLLGYRILCEAGGSLPEDELVRRLGGRIDPQRFGFLQTRNSKGREVLEDLLKTGCVARNVDGSIKVVKPMTFVSTEGAKRVEFSLKASGRGLDCRWFSSHDR